VSESDISETVSQKPKRGRPPLLSAEAMAMWGSLMPGATPRTIQNFYYQFRAQGFLKDDPACGWLTGHGSRRQLLLSELGRIPNDADLVHVARSICEMKPTAKRGVAMIRGGDLAANTWERHVAC
jgi:hypothetical protein